MGNMIGKISPIKREFSKEGGQSLATSLAEKGYTMFPGTSNLLCPWKERTNDYRTGLDPDALYIQKMGKAEAEMERSRVEKLHEELTKLTGLDLSPRSSYYKDMFDSYYAKEERAEHVKLIDGFNLFNLSIPRAAITFAWLRVHPNIAPSYTAWERGQSSFRCPLISDCKFFVDDVDYETEVKYKQNILIDKAVNSLTTMNPTRQLKLAKLLSLPVSYNSTPEFIYNELSDFIKNESTQGRKISNVTVFNDISGMTDDNIEIKFRIKEAIDLNVYRVAKHGKIYEGETLLADTEKELADHFLISKNQEEFLALRKKIDTAKSIEI